MGNIWGFLLQTFSVSLVAVLLLLMKRLLEDKLSPRWQYGIWGILALRILLPIDEKRYVPSLLFLYLETLKAIVEQMLDSAYSAAYELISVRFVFPIVTQKPSSMTDWLFVIYAAGVILCLLRYLVSYLRLKSLLRKGEELPENLKTEVKNVCEIYGFKPCRVVTVRGLPSAFLCGVFDPVMAVPADKMPDEKVLLHELLHLKYQDALQNIVWCILRALHWCNPFLQYVFDRIGNDMESLCDQRVLERLEGEKRREYGMILLEMADEKYARVPGTTSISNGGKNISRRIAAIVRFKKYPKGMALVSICIALVLAVPSIWGRKSVYANEKYNLDSETSWKMEKSIAIARVSRCTTVAGALDTYAKGLLNKNDILIAAASPMSEYKKIANEIKSHAEQGEEARTTTYNNEGYSVYNLSENADGTYEALLVLTAGWVETESSKQMKKMIMIPVVIRHEDAWVVEETGEHQVFAGSAFDLLSDPDSEIPWLKTSSVTGEGGEITLQIRTQYVVNNMLSDNRWNFFGQTGFDDSVKVNAVFEYGRTFALIRYDYKDAKTKKRPETSVGIQTVAVSSINETPKFPDVEMKGDFGGGTSDGYDYANQTIREEYHSVICTSDNQSYGLKSLMKLPKAYNVRVFWDGRMVEELTLETMGEVTK